MYVTPELRVRALIHDGQRGDKTWGLVDCASFIVMQHAGVAEAFTKDKDLSQDGFKCLLPTT